MQASGGKDRGCLDRSQREEAIEKGVRPATPAPPESSEREAVSQSSTLAGVEAENEQPAPEDESGVDPFADGNQHQQHLPHAAHSLAEIYELELVPRLGIQRQQALTQGERYPRFGTYVSDLQGLVAERSIHCPQAD